MPVPFPLSYKSYPAPDWLAAAVAGIVAGAVLMLLSLLWAANDIHMQPWMLARRIAAITMGQQVLASADFSITVVAVMAVTHYVLGVLFAAVLAAIISIGSIKRSPAAVMLIGALFGLLLYVVNFYLLAERFPWFVDMRGGPPLIAHLIFGLVSAGVYLKFDRHTDAI